MDIAVQKGTLLARRNDLISMMKTIEKRLEETPARSWEDRSSERQGDEVLEVLGCEDQAELKRIDAALERMKAGTYGTCMTCGAEIDSARLSLVPATPFCRFCMT